MMKKLKRNPRAKWFLVIVVIIALGITIFFTGRYLGLWAAAPRQGQLTCTVFALGQDEEVTEDAKIKIYKAALADFDDPEESVTFKEYDAETSMIDADKLNLYIDIDTYSYYYKCEYKDSVSWGYVPEPGDLVITMVDQTEALDIFTLGDNGTTTIASTTETDWEFIIRADSKDEGLLYAYQFDDDLYLGLLLNMTFDTEADKDFVDFNYPVDTEEDGNNLYVKVLVDWNDDITIEAEFDSDLGDDFNILSVEPLYGDYPDDIIL